VLSESRTDEALQGEEALQGDEAAGSASEADWAGRYQTLGITEIVLHWPVPDSVFATDPDVFEKIVTEGMSQL
jgi:hypothetical protein